MSLKLFQNEILTKNSHNSHKYPVDATEGSG